MEPSKKRASNDTTTNAKKKMKIEVPADKNAQLQQFQEAIEELEQACAKEQLQIQRKFDAQKVPHYKARDALMAELGLWPRAIMNCEALVTAIQDVDTEILQEYLKTVELNDHLDDNGTFALKFIFKDSASTLFTPTTVVKSIAYNEQGRIDLDRCESTEVKFVDESRNPVTICRNRRNSKAAAAKGGDESDDESLDSDLEFYSIFEWFASKGDEPWPGFADYFRTMLYQNPLEPALGPDLSDIEDTSSDSEE
eukprot:Gregarina_sp_Poly_1__563@NODE_1134_length_4985_cov_108_670394_g783_i0_p3_GENE_NODE_1134_length_4985_cov_108_670394_g783_i0NODE_1134_length_4985_cov_108_670394_g783_i0_p3_ORF_typecomplete_len253_score49_59NAP/PF00956_18/5_1e03NAP/PF00956_18/3_9e13TPR_9/PF13371_6/0_41DNA_pol3_a_NII/PF11490_8/0_87_NODE_1134_length_4985_cov_108_670394_g783_i040644822